MRLRIVGCRQIYSSMTNGRRYTIFEIDAAKPDGQLVREKLRAFEALPIGEEIDVTVQAFDSEQHGRSYTIHRKGSNNATERVNELAPRVAELEAVVQRIEPLEGAYSKLYEKLEALERRVNELANSRRGVEGQASW